VSTPAAAQVCGGDVDGNGFVTSEDLTPLFSFLVASPGLSPQQRDRADANRDRSVTAADVVRILRINGLNCAAPTATPTPTATVTPVLPTATRTISPTPSATQTSSRTANPTVTATVTRTRTLTATRTITPTPTAVCMESTIGVGTTNAEITLADCVRRFAGIGAAALRHADAYRLSVPPGQAASIQVVALGTPAIAPVIRVIDPDGQFEITEGQSPVEITSTSTAPYMILVASLPSSPYELGPYRITIALRPCPPPEGLTIPDVANGSLDITDCPDPGAPSVGRSANPADVFTFNVSSVPTNLDITLRRVGVESAFDAVFSLIGPDGFELFDPSEADDAFAGDIEGIDAQARFLATQTGIYRLLVYSNASFIGTSGQLEGGGRYSLSMRAPVCPPLALGAIPTSPTSLSGMLTGNLATTRCAAPLQMPFISDDLPELNSASQLYTFTGAAGEVISLGLESDDDPHLFVYGPLAAGYPLIARDDDSSAISSDGAQLALTLPMAGTYLVVVANNFALTAPDPDDPEDRTGDVTMYTLSMQRCTTTGGLNLETSAMVSSQFTTFDCRGFGNRQHRSYSFQGTAGQFVTVEMSSSAINPFLRVVGPDGSVVASDSDGLDPGSLNARINLLLPVEGIYYVEASRSIGGQDPLPDGPATFTLRAISCPLTTTVAGGFSGSFAANDCSTASGRRFDVYQAPAGTMVQQVLSVLPPANGCVIGLMPGGDVVPKDSCLQTQLDMPIAARPQLAGFIVAAPAGQTSGAYSGQLSVCPLTTMTFGELRTGSLGGGSCTTANGRVAAMLLIRGADGVVRQTGGMSASLTTTFASASEVIVPRGPLPAGSLVALDDPGDLFLFGSDRAALLRVSGVGATDLGSYSVEIDQASYRR